MTVIAGEIICFKTVTNYTGIRTVSTVYQNIFRTTRHVLYSAETGALSGIIWVYVSSDSNIDVDARVAGTTIPANSVGDVSFLVPSGYYYKITDDTATEVEWVEID